VLIIHILQRQGDKIIAACNEERDGQGQEEEHLSRARWRPARSRLNMSPFKLTTYLTGAHRFVIAAVGNEVERSGRRVCKCPPHANFECHASKGSSLLASWECVCVHRLAASMLCRLGVPFRRCGDGQESTPIVLLFLRHNTSYLGM